MKIPPLARPGDLILIVTPSFAGETRELELGIKTLENLGFKVETSANAAGKNWGRFPANDQNRLDDLQWALDHPKARIVLCFRGGYGMTRIVDKLNFEGISRFPKWVIGFSDITLLHSKLQEVGLASLHGPMLAHFARPDHKPACLEAIDFITGRQPFLKYVLQAVQTSSEEQSGTLRGGNLSLLSHQIGKKTHDFPENTVLFLEEVGEAYYRIDRMLWQLSRSGSLDNLSAIVLGQFTDCLSDDFPLTIPEMILEKTKVPIFSGLPAGHGVPGFPVVCGGKVTIRKEEGAWVFSQTARTISSTPEI